MQNNKKNNNYKADILGFIDAFFEPLFYFLIFIIENALDILASIL